MRLLPVRFVFPVFVTLGVSAFLAHFLSQSTGHIIFFFLNFINSHNSEGEGGNRKHFPPEVYCLKRVQLFPRIRASTKRRGIRARPHKKAFAWRKIFAFPF